MRPSRIRRTVSRGLARHTLLFSLAAACLVPAAGAKTFQLPSQNNRIRSWAVTDMNGDKVADLASAGPGRREGAEYAREISVNLAGADKTRFTVHSPGAAIQLSLRDIDGDHDRDLIVVEPWSRQAIGVWLNDGQGHFEEGNLAKYSPALGQPPPHSLSTSFRVRLHLFARNEERTSHTAPVVSSLERRQFSEALVRTDDATVVSAPQTTSSPRAPPSLA
ncbi:MAG TPA: hypothetical protein VFT60_09615 [Bryobacteraceae bacterium]|jgi:hypothetical protein|nr:hypothetical protein [Bryobacteraceae bacterium]